MVKRLKWGGTQPNTHSTLISQAYSDFKFREENTLKLLNKAYVYSYTKVVIVSVKTLQQDKA
jgi:hypothetical protein